MNKQATIHIRDNNNGVMTAREMYAPDKAAMHFATDNYLSAAQMFLENHYPDSRFNKTGWSANASEAIYHFNVVSP